jgi:UDP-N-acetylglucosamine kinase
MRGDVSPWRVGDSVAYEAVLQAADEGLASAPISDDAVALRIRVLETDGFDRGRVSSLESATSRTSPAAGVSGDPEGILERAILPSVFAGAQTTDHPRLVLLSGQPGSGRSRAIARLRSEESDGMAVVSADLLRSFTRGLTGDVIDPDEAAAVSASWLVACMRHAREHRLSLLLDGPIPAGAAEGILAGFARDGYRTHVAAVGSARAESLLAVASAYASRAREGRRSDLVPVDQHDRDLAETRELLGSAADAGARVTVFDRDGRIAADGVDARGAVRAFNRASKAELSTLQAVQWLSELKRVTAYSRRPSSQLPELSSHLVTLHEVALRDIIPSLRVPPGSFVSRELESRLASDLVAMRQPVTPIPTWDVAAPSAAPGGPGTGGPSR